MSRIEVRKSLLLGVGILLVALPVRGQGNATCTVGSGAYNTYGVNGKVGAPFSGTTKTTFEQTLADGSRIHSETTSFQARDSVGRVRTEEVEDCRGWRGWPASSAGQGAGFRSDDALESDVGDRGEHAEGRPGIPL